MPANTQPVAFDLPLDAYEILKRIQQEREESKTGNPTYAGIVAELLRREDKKGKGK